MLLAEAMVVCVPCLTPRLWFWNLLALRDKAALHFHCGCGSSQTGPFDMGVGWARVVTQGSSATYGHSCLVPART